MGGGVGVASDMKGAITATRNWRARLEETNVCSGTQLGGALESNRKLYSVPKRIALAFWFCAKVSVLQVTDCETLSKNPWRAAISSVSLGAIMRKARMLRRRMKPDVTDVIRVERRDKRFERLNRAIEILVIEGVLIVPDASSRVLSPCNP